MFALFLSVLLWSGGTLLAWLLVEPLIRRLLPRLERFLPDDIIGPDAWLADTANQAGIFDLPLKQRKG